MEYKVYNKKDGIIRRTVIRKERSNAANEQNNRDNANIDVDDYNRNNQGEYDNRPLNHDTRDDKRGNTRRGWEWCL